MKKETKLNTWDEDIIDDARSTARYARSALRARTIDYAARSATRCARTVDHVFVPVWRIHSGDFGGSPGIPPERLMDFFLSVWLILEVPRGPHRGD